MSIDYSFSFHVLMTNFMLHLLHQWKAAKEELHGDNDEEPEDALEILEKKRQKEIEVLNRAFFALARPCNSFCAGVSTAKRLNCAGMACTTDCQWRSSR